MSNKKISQFILVFVLFAVSVGILFGINALTAERISANSKGAEFEPLYAVMPEADSFEQLTFDTVPETVKSVWKETSGLGFVVRCATNKGFTGEFIELTVGIGSDGKICGITLDAYPESKDFGKDTYPLTYLGQDSTLSGVSIVAGVTYSSSAFKGAVNDAFAVLVDNGLMKAGVKSADQIVSEMLPASAEFMANAAGIVQADQVTATSSSVVSAWKSKNKLGLALWINDGSGDYLAVCHVNGTVKVLDLEGNDVTDSVSSVVAVAKTEAASLLKSSAAKDIKKLTKLVPADSVVTEVSSVGVLSDISTVCKAETSDGVLYGFTIYPYGFSNETMVVHVVIDSNGAIYALTADQLIIEAEYFSGYTLDTSSYKANFKGLTSTTYTDDVAVVSGATLTTQAVQTAVKDAFEAYSVITGGKN